MGRRMTGQGRHGPHCGMSASPVRAEDYGGREDALFLDPASVELVGVVAVEDQVVAGQQGCEGPVVWLEADFGVVVVEPLADQWEPGFIHRFLGAEQQPIPARAVRFMVAAASRSRSAGVAIRSSTPSGSGASGSASIPIVEIRETVPTAAAA